MDGLRLLSAAGLGTSTSPVRQWGSDLILTAVVGVVAFICALVAAGWSAIALHLALQPHVSDVAAAGLTAATFLIIIGLLVGFLRWHFGRNDQPRPQAEQHPGELDLGSLGNLSSLMPPPGQPMKGWDLATMVAIGVITGLSRNNGR